MAFHYRFYTYSIDLPLEIPNPDKAKEKKNFQESINKAKTESKWPIQKKKLDFIKDKEWAYWERNTSYINIERLSKNV